MNTNETQTICLIVRGPSIIQVNFDKIAMALAQHLTVVTFDLTGKRGNFFRFPDKAKVAAIVIVGNPNITTNGLREMFPLATIAVLGLEPSGSPLSDTIYHTNMDTLAEEVISEVGMSQVLLDQIVLPDGFVRVDEIESHPQDAFDVPIKEEEILLGDGDLIWVDQRTEAAA